MSGFENKARFGVRYRPYSNTTGLVLTQVDCKDT